MGRQQKEFIFSKTWIKQAGLIGVFCLLFSQGGIAQMGQFYHLLPQVSGDYIWTGLAEDNLWSNPLNWTTYSVPTSNDVARFHGDACAGANCNSTVNINANVAGIEIDAAYGGTITQSSGITMTVGTDGWVQANGTFAGGDSDITINGVFTLNGGDFTATSAQMLVTSGFDYTAGAFHHNNGLLRFDDNNIVQGNTTIPVNLPGNVELYDLQYSIRYQSSNSEYKVHINSGSFDVQNQFRLGRISGNTNSRVIASGGTIYLKGNLVADETGTSSSSKGTSTPTSLVLNGTGPQTYDTSTDSWVPHLIIDKTSGTVTPTVGTTNLLAQQFTLTLGSFTAPPGTFQIAGDFAIQAGTTYTDNGGSLNFSKLNFGGSQTFTITLDYALTTNNLTFGGGGSGSVASTTWNFSGSDPTINATGDLSISNTNGGSGAITVNGGDIYVAGNFTAGRYIGAGTSTITFNGTGAQTYIRTGSGTANIAGNITVDKTSGTLTTASAATFNHAGQDLTITEGVMDLAGYNLTVNDVLRIEEDGKLICNGGTATAGSYVVLGEVSCGPTVGITWTGLAGNNLWTDPDNWTNNTVPGSSDIAIFNDKCSGANCNVSINTNISVKGVQIQPTYTGTITQQSTRTITIGTMGWAQEAGTFLGGDSNISFGSGGSFILSGGSFTSTSATLSMRGHFTVSGTAVFAHNSGHVSYTNGGTFNISMDTGSFWKLTLGGFDGFFDLSGAITVENLLTISDDSSTPGTINSGTIIAKGDVSFLNYGKLGTALLKVGGSTNQQISGSSNASIVSFEVASTGGTVSYSGILYFRSDYNYTSGVLDPGTSTLFFGAINGVPTNITPGPISYYNVTFGGYDGRYELTEDITVIGTLRLEDGSGTPESINSNTILAYGNLEFASNGKQGTTKIKVVGSTNQAVTGSSSASIPDFEIASTGGTVTYSGTLNIKYNYTYTSGTLATGASTVLLNGDNDTYTAIPGTSDYNNVTLGGKSATYEVVGTWNIKGALTIRDANNSTKGSINTGDLHAYGDVSFTNYGKNGNANLKILGATTANLSSVSGAVELQSDITIEKSGGASVVMTGMVPLATSGQSLTVKSGGVLDLNGNSLTVNNILTVEAGATLRCNGGTYTVGTFINNGTYNCPGDPSYDFNWTGAGGTTSWNNAANWQGGAVPGATKPTVVFNDNYCGANCDALIDSSINVDGFILESPYSGTITQGAGNTMTIGGYGWSQADGAFIGSDSNITISLFPDTGDFSLTGGSFQSTSATLEVGINVHVSLVSRTLFKVNAPTATFNHNNGTLKIAGRDTWNGTATFAMDVGTVPLVLNNLIFHAPGNYGNGHYILPGQTVTVLNDFEILDGLFREGGNLEVYGNLSMNITHNPNYGEFGAITMKGSNNQTYSHSGTKEGPKLIVDKTGGTLTAASTDFRISELYVLQGTFTAPPGVLTIGYTYRNTWTFGESIFKLHSPSAFIDSGGTVIFGKYLNNLGAPFDSIEPNGDLTLNNVEVQSSKHSLPAGQKIIVNGTFTHTSGTLESDWTLKGNAAFNSSSRGTATLTFSGTGNQTLSGLYPTTGDWTVNKTSGAVTFANAFNLNGAGQNLTITQGTLDMAGKNLSVTGNITNNGTLKRGTSPTCGTLTYGSYTGNPAVCP